MNNKIKALLQMFGEKISRSSWNVEDLIKVGLLTNTKLAFIDENNNPIIVFDENDLK